jgi:hypothetical protein
MLEQKNNFILVLVLIANFYFDGVIVSKLLVLGVSFTILYPMVMAAEAKNKLSCMVNYKPRDRLVVEVLNT